MDRKEHLLTILVEECAEVQYETCKGLRFGLDDFYEEHSPKPNKERLVEELADLMAVVELLQEEGYLGKLDETRKKSKKERVEKFLLYSKERKLLT
jgi:NTP pyrophosphatase (non-canonical NTP hydrolase)